MSRLFAGPTIADRITFGMGTGSIPTDGGPITMVALARYTGTTTGDAWFMQASTSGSAASWGMLVSGGKFYNESNFGAGGPSAPSNQWFWVAVTKANGSAQPRWHVHNLDAGTAWSHTADPATTVGDGAAGPNKITVGGPVGTTANQTWRGQLGICAVFNTVLTDLQIEAACTLAAADLKTAAPQWMIRLNQSSTATSVTDDTTGGANQTALSGTAVDASEPTGFNYSLTTTTPFTKDQVERYRVLNAVTKDTVERYRVTNAVTKDVVEAYRVLNALSKDQVERYRVTNALSKDQAEVYRVFTVFSKDQVERYRLTNAVTKDTAESYRVLNAVAKDAVESYRVFNAVAKDLVESYRVLNGWIKNVVEVYSVLTTNPFTKDLPESYRVFGALSKDFVDRYRVLNGWTLDRAESYRLFNAWTKDVADSYSVLGGAPFSKDLVERYRLFAAFSIDRIERFNAGAFTRTVNAVAYLDAPLTISDLTPVTVMSAAAGIVTAYLDD